MTTKPLTTIDRDGRPGRPAKVRNVARKRIAEAMAAHLVTAGLIPSGFTKKKIEAACLEVGENVLQSLADHDLHLIHGAIIRELALIVGEAAPTQPPKQPADTPA